MTLNLDHRPDLTGQILYLLRGHPEGLPEHQLIQLLKIRYPTYILYREPADKLVLFRTHLLLFNALCHLHDHLWAKREMYLEISPLSLRLHPYVGDTQALEQDDSLRDYCLDLRYLEEASEADVEWLLQSFWMCMQDSEEKTAVPALFELKDTIDYPAIKLRYWQLVSQRHPDRGGSIARL